MATAITYFDRQLTIAREIGDRRGEANASWNLGLLLEQQGDLERAILLMQVSTDFEREIGHADVEQHAARLTQVQERYRKQKLDETGEA